jgi:hypothetical protein
LKPGSAPPDIPAAIPDFPLFPAVIGEVFFLLLLCWILGLNFSSLINGLRSILLLSNNSGGTAGKQRE